MWSFTSSFSRGCWEMKRRGRSGSKNRINSSRRDWIASWASRFPFLFAMVNKSSIMSLLCTGSFCTRDDIAPILSVKVPDVNILRSHFASPTSLSLLFKLCKCAYLWILRAFALSSSSNSFPYAIMRKHQYHTFLRHRKITSSLFSQIPSPNFSISSYHFSFPSIGKIPFLLY